MFTIHWEEVVYFLGTIMGILDGGERLGKFIGRYREAYFKAGSMLIMYLPTIYGVVGNQRTGWEVHDE